MSEFHDFLKEILAPFGEITIRKMFGGAGVYCDGFIFGLEVEDQLYLKGDSQTEALYADADMAPFMYEKKDGKQAAMSYFLAPEDIYEDDTQRDYWIKIAIDAGLRNKKKKQS